MSSNLDRYERIAPLYDLLNPTIRVRAPTRYHAKGHHAAVGARGLLGPMGQVLIAEQRSAFRRLASKSSSPVLWWTI